jgi:hypothetical protein
MKNSLKNLIEYGIITIPTNCQLCFGTGELYPTSYSTPVCPNGCNRLQKRYPKGVSYGGDTHPQVLVRCGVLMDAFNMRKPWKIAETFNFARVAWVDAGVANIINLLWSCEIDTWVSCQGHGKRIAGDAYVGLCLVDDKKIDLARDIISKYGIITSEEDYRENDEYEGSSDYIFRWLWK